MNITVLSLISDPVWEDYTISLWRLVAGGLIGRGEVIERVN